MKAGFLDPERLAAAKLVELALAEDLDDAGDLTSQALIAEDERAEVSVVARHSGILSGLPVAALVFQRLDSQVAFNSLVEDGTRVAPDDVVATIAGPLRPVLSGERTCLNFLSHLSGVASLTRQYVQAVSGTQGVILDTRKTLPGWRLLQKYAVRCGGGRNHRLGLYDGVLIKDNHLAAWSASHGTAGIGDAVRRARESLDDRMPVEIEVDSLEQLVTLFGKESSGQPALPDGGRRDPALPDVVLLDNMDLASLRRAVEFRDRQAPGVLLEASGGVSQQTVTGIAETGIDRISVGALTHSAPALDLAFDWH